MSVDISGGITAYLTGGFGNQLFVAAAGFALSQRLGCQLFLDVSGLEQPGEIRSFALSELDFGATVLGAESPWAGDHPARGQSGLGRFHRKLTRRSSSKVYREGVKSHPSDFDRLDVGTTIVGYFQRAEYFASADDAIAEIIEAPSRRQDLGDHAKPRNARLGSHITLHVRRGDYLTPNTRSYHGLATAAYVKRALGLVRKIHGDIPAVVFSDSPQLVMEELASLRDLHFVMQDEHSSDLFRVLDMSRGESMVMSNSSYSWWAAWLMSRRDPSAVVVAPRPWFSDERATPGLLAPSWLTLDSRYEPQ